MISTLEPVVGQRDRMVLQYAYLCRRGARKFIRPGIDRADLEQVATLGLLKACDRYDASKKTPFEAYAWLFILGELMHYVRDYERLIRPPRRLRRLDRLAHEAQETLVRELGRNPTRQDLAAKLGVTPADIEAVAHYREQAVCEPIDSTLRICPVVESPTETSENRVIVREALRLLSSAERAVVLGLYAVGLTQIELARRLGFSRRHISRLHLAALRKMRPAVLDNHGH